MRIEILGNSFLLLHQKAIYWENEKILLIADLHLGKITHFRKEGIAVPTNAVTNNFERLTGMLGTHDVKQIIFLGDLFHNRYNDEWKLFADWRMRCDAVEMAIVLGNHDILPLSLFETCDITVFHGSFRIGNFLFTHHPQEKIEEGVFVFCGHIHPVFLLQAKGRQQLRLPCFVQDKQQMILPGFGVFTGGFEMKVIVERKIYLIAEKKILCVSE